LFGTRANTGLTGMRAVCTVVTSVQRVCGWWVGSQGVGRVGRGTGRVVVPWVGWGTVLLPWLLPYPGQGH